MNLRGNCQARRAVDVVDFHTDAHGWISSSKLPEAMPRGAFAGALGAGAGASAMVWLPLLWGLPLAFLRGAGRLGGAATASVRS